ncbi:neutral zinc metallopeptidase [Streptosporangiaceae bacterium NEAU-GS5]|nr:neutral zinc metallopeptidase [Streptosporangiaceae bacterium NEAU-GS5]
MRGALLAIALIATLTASCGIIKSPRDLSGPAEDGGASSASSPCDQSGDDFAGDVGLARCLTEWFWSRQFQQSGQTYRPITRFVAYQGENGPDCGGQPAVPNNAFYCPAGHFVAFDETWLRAMYDQMGDGAVYVIIPHELGHAVQDQLVNDFRFNIQRELQADCYAGAALSGLVQAKYLRTEEGDSDELLTSLAEAGDPTDAWFAPDAHGTPAQRQNFFATGFDQGAAVC